MTLLRRSSNAYRSAAGVLADIAHELSGTSNWEARVENAISLLCDIIQNNVSALGLHLETWKVFTCPDVDSPDELAKALLTHYSMMTGEGLGEFKAGEGIPLIPQIIHETKDGVGSYLSLPVIGDDRVIGVLHVRIDKSDAYSMEDVSILSVVALQIGSFLKNVEAANREAGDKEVIQKLLDEAGHRAAELQSILASIADGVSVLSPDGTLKFMNKAGRDIIGASADDAIEDYFHAFQRYDENGNLISTEEAASYRAMQGETIRNARQRVITRWGKEAILSISSSPVLDSQGSVIGIVNVFHDVSEQVRFENEKQALYEREHHIAEVLQKALIPEFIPERMNRCRIAAKYQSALAEAEIGGDFYDVFDLGDGRFGVLVGDVAGKGLLAAIRVASARYAVRSYAFLDSSPGVVMTLANEALCREKPFGINMLTAFYALVNTEQGTITYANAGHEPPVVCNAGGNVSELEIGGRPLGIMRGYTFGEASYELQPGDSIVILTDGLTEARNKKLELFDKSGVLDWLSLCRCDEPDHIASGLLEAAIEHAGGKLQDDVAIVVMRYDYEEQPTQGSSQ